MTSRTQGWDAQGVRLRSGWFLRRGTSKAPRGWYVLEYGLETTTAARDVVACIHPDQLSDTPQLYPEAFEAIGEGC